MSLLTYSSTRAAFMEISGKSVNLFFANFLQENYNSTLSLVNYEQWYSCTLKCLQYWVKKFKEVQDVLLSVVTLLVYVSVQCYPWFKFYFPLFQTHLRDLESCLGKWQTEDSNIWDFHKTEYMYVQIKTLQTYSLG